MGAGSVGRLRLTLPTALCFAGGPGAGVREGQLCGCRNGACGVRTGARLRPLCPCSKAPDGLPGGGLRALFRREAPGPGFLSMERPAAEPQAEREGVEGEERRVADTAGYI